MIPQKFRHNRLKNYQYAFTFLRRVGFKPYPTEKRRGHCLMTGYIATTKWQI